MALTKSSMTNLGSTAPVFTLPDTVSGKTVALYDLNGEAGTVIMFLCNHFPYVKHVNQALVRTANEYLTSGINFVAISSNDATVVPEDGPEEMKLVAQRENYPFPYLYDETQDVARAYQAVCTPDVFVYDVNLKLVYRGRIDGTRPGVGVATANELRGAIRAMIANQYVSEIQYPSIGCSIKWK